MVNIAVFSFNPLDFIKHEAVENISVKKLILAFYILVNASWVFPLFARS